MIDIPLLRFEVERTEGICRIAICLTSEILVILLARMIDSPGIWCQG